MTDGNKTSSPETSNNNQKRDTLKKVFFIVVALFCLTPYVSPPIALLMGIVIAQFMVNPFIRYNHKATNYLLKASVIGLGFGMNAYRSLEAGKEGLLFTFVSIVGTLIVGYFLGRWLKLERKTTHLISTGTAICGGSAIAAVSPVIRADEKQISVALGIVFILNSIALFIFPMIGHFLELSQTQFGMWSAIAIHDTSSVVGAASRYGAQALEIATTVKLTRTLWIIPVAILSSILFKNKNSKLKIPYFIGLFVLAMFANTYIPFVRTYSPYVVDMAKAGLTLTLFLIGSGLSKSVVKSVGIKPLILGILLWVLISISSLWVILGSY